MRNRETLLKLAHATHELIDGETDRLKLAGLSSLAVEVKQVLDSSGISDDLGTELLEFAQMKRDGHSKYLSFKAGAAQTMDRLAVAHSTRSTC